MKKSTLTQCAVSVFLAVSLGSIAFAQERPPEEEAISIGNRHNAIADIVGKWSESMSSYEGWEEEFTAALNGASDKQLLAIQGAGSYNHVSAILQGRSAPATLDGVVGTEALGDLTSDLLYTPVVPCRFFDTRFDNVAGPGHNTGSTATTRSYRVHGTAGLLAHQGYNKGVSSGAGCPSPKGEPVAIAGNFTAAGPAGNGNIRAWPTGGSLPNVSLVNYTTSTNIANAAIVATGYNIGDDINVTMQFGTVDSLGDVMGYFYPADSLGNLVETGLHGYDGLGGTVITSTNTDVFLNPGVGDSTFTFSGGESVVWNFSAQVERNGGTGNTTSGRFNACYRNTANNVVTCPNGFAGETDFCIQSSGALDQSSVQTAGRVESMPAGTYEFGVSADHGSQSCGGGTNNYQVSSPKILVTVFN